MSVKINLGEWGSVFAVPTGVVDKYLKLASPNQLKVLLFLLRNSEIDYSKKEISDTLRIHEDDIDDCISFWIERGVLADNGSSLEPKLGEPVAEKPEPKSEPKPAAVKHAVPRPMKPDLITAAQLVSEDSTLQALLSEVEAALSKPLSNGDTSTIVMLYDTCGLPAEVITLLVNYCVSIGKSNIRAIERIGVKWADEGIDSMEAADNKIKQSRQSGINWSRVSSVFGLKNVGSPTAKQLEYADRWIGEWKFSDDMLRAAYERCVDNTGKLGMSYINKILERWHSAGIITPDDIERLDTKKPSVTKKQKASYDISVLEKIQ